MSNAETEVQVYDFRGNNVRTVVVNKEPWFVGKDVAGAIGYKDTKNALKSHVRDKYKRGWRITTSSGEQEMTIISEPGVYQIASQSKLENAVPFQDWVYEEVLPSIRKYGAYMTDTTLDQVANNPDLLIKLANNLKTEREARKKAELKIKADKDKVQFAIDLATSDHNVLVGTFAKQLKQAGFDTGQNRLFEQLRKEHYLMSASGKDRYNLPTQYSIDQGLFEIRTSRHYNWGLDKLEFSYTPMITPKGQIYFTKKFLHENN